MAGQIANARVLEQAAKEAEFVNKYNISPVFYLDDRYPQRLQQCPDAPVLLYVKGNCNLNQSKIVNIIGTRNATPYGREFTEKLVAGFASRHPDMIVISGLAYGIDIYAHKAALKNNITTIAVLAHGLHTIYPPAHANVAREIIANGALVTEFTSNTGPDRPNFVRRNRIVAGMADATVVVESGERGGALITAELANSYNRDVFALPGRNNDEKSRGCNKLIKTNKACLFENIDDIEYIMGWQTKHENSKAIQKQLFVQLSADEQIIIDVLKQQGETNIDSICFYSNMPVSKVSALLLNLEFSGMVRSLPGKVFKLC
jgi:DNA processing protein